MERDGSGGSVTPRNTIMTYPQAEIIKNSYPADIALLKTECRTASMLHLRLQSSQMIKRDEDTLGLMDGPRFISVFDEQLLKRELDTIGVKHLHIYSIWRHVLANKDAKAHEVPGLPQALYPLLRNKFRSLTSSIRACSHSANGSTTKLLINLQSGESVEAVIMRHDSGAGKCSGGLRPGGRRATLCVSSQVGCKMACSFCATGTMGFVANLSAGEIVEQLVHALRIPPIRNIVFMGMGEPLNNYNNVLQALRTVTGRCFSLGPNHITVSTVGIVPRMLTLAVDIPGVNLALSLHAPSQELRCQIVPAAKAFSLDKLMNAIDSYIAASKRRVLIEYVMLAGVNDSEENAHKLGSLLYQRNVVVNLIPYNHTVVVANYSPSAMTDVVKFQKVIRQNYGIRATVRQEMGQDIDGACGQLALKHHLPDIEDVYSLVLSGKTNTVI